MSTAQLDDLARQATTITDGDLIAQLSYVPALLIEAPDEIREALCAAFEVHCTYRADQGQVTIPRYDRRQHAGCCRRSSRCPRNTRRHGKPVTRRVSRPAGRCPPQQPTAPQNDHRRHVRTFGLLL